MNAVRQWRYTETLLAGNLLKPRKTLLSLSGFLIQHHPRINLILRESLAGYQEDNWTNAIRNYRFLRDRPFHIENFFHPIRNFERLPSRP